MLGRLDEAALMDFYELVDFIVVPSRSDCFPMAQSEAMTAGLPSVVSDIPGARYLVQKTGFGLVAKPGDTADLGRQLLKAAGSIRELRKNHDKVLSVLDNGKNVRTIRQYLKPRN
jgi:glycosyltransferase involved in cell wall biosynthesis